ncbi:MAG: DUF4351 domain-containing protein [Acaryochloridaceae cyanobacterium RU_4_10]|nr:DUF4351 domain-containing protein [Acaryochloridaceae cyanobacterium RU_4_10]
MYKLSGIVWILKLYRYLFTISFILRQLTCRIGSVTPEMRSQVQTLPLAQLESLSEALLDFKEDGDLLRWLREN